MRAARTWCIGNISPWLWPPRPVGPDKDGCWSGSAFINEGVPTLVYTGVFPQVQCLATSDDDMTTWKKFSGNPVVGAPPAGLAVTGFRDPSIWREGDSWLMTVGSGFQAQGGAVLLYGSKDLEHWDYLHPLFTAPPFERRDSARSSRYEPMVPVTCGNARTFSLWGRSTFCWFHPRARPLLCGYIFRSQVPGGDSRIDRWLRTALCLEEF